VLTQAVCGDVLEHYVRPRAALLPEKVSVAASREPFHSRPNNDLDIERGAMEILRFNESLCTHRRCAPRARFAHARHWDRSSHRRGDVLEHIPFAHARHFVRLEAFSLIPYLHDHCM
jgi:hypothetical protein